MVNFSVMRRLALGDAFVDFSDQSYQRIGHRDRIVSLWPEFPQGLRQAFEVVHKRRREYPQGWDLHKEFEDSSLRGSRYDKDP
jgi:hypothetical protein